MKSKHIDFSAQVRGNGTKLGRFHSKSITPSHRHHQALEAHPNFMKSTDSLLNDQSTRRWVKFGEPWSKTSLSLFLAMVVQGYRVNEISRALRCSSSQVVAAAKKYSILLQA
jgi:hypothetical protein